MKARVMYLAPGLVLTGIHGLRWATAAPSSHASTFVLAVGVTVLLQLLYNAHRREAEAREAAAAAREAALTAYGKARDVADYSHRILHAQNTTIARLIARLYRRSPQ